MATTAGSGKWDKLRVPLPKKIEKVHKDKKKYTRKEKHPCK